MLLELQAPTLINVNHNSKEKRVSEICTGLHSSSDSWKPPTEKWDGITSEHRALKDLPAKGMQRLLCTPWRYTLCACFPFVMEKSINSLE